MAKRQKNDWFLKKFQFCGLFKKNSIFLLQIRKVDKILRSLVYLAAHLKIYKKFKKIPKHWQNVKEMIGF